MQWIARANLPVKPAETSSGAGSAQVYDRRVKPLALVAVVALVALAGCARDAGEAQLPTACVSSEPADLLLALEAAPDPVRVDGTAISDCLPKRSSAGEIQDVGFLMLRTAQRLGDESRALPLGYLVGALRRGAEDSPGLHLEIVRRIEQEAEPLSDTLGFARGERAGRTSG